MRSPEKKKKEEEEEEEAEEEEAAAAAGGGGGGGGGRGRLFVFCAHCRKIQEQARCRGEVLNAGNLWETRASSWRAAMRQEVTPVAANSRKNITIESVCVVIFRENITFRSIAVFFWRVERARAHLVRANALVRARPRIIAPWAQ